MTCRISPSSAIHDIDDCDVAERAGIERLAARRRIERRAIEHRRGPAFVCLDANNRWRRTRSDRDRCSRGARSRTRSRRRSAGSATPASRNRARAAGSCRSGGRGRRTDRDRSSYASARSRGRASSPSRMMSAFDRRTSGAMISQRLPSTPALRRERRETLECLEIFRPAVRIARVVERVDANDDRLRADALPPSQARATERSCCAPARRSTECRRRRGRDPSESRRRRRSADPPNAARLTSSSTWRRDAEIRRDIARGRRLRAACTWPYRTVSA